MVWKFWNSDMIWTNHLGRLIYQLSDHLNSPTSNTPSTTFSDLPYPLTSAVTTSTAPPPVSTAIASPPTALAALLKVEMKLVLARACENIYQHMVVEGVVHADREQDNMIASAISAVMQFVAGGAAVRQPKSAMKSMIDVMAVMNMHSNNMLFVTSIYVPSDSQLNTVFTLSGAALSAALKDFTQGYYKLLDYSVKAWQAESLH
ncbi:hypothetical protein EDC04DRAFT_2600251 [Pisolithus marmoratus]|nr:hypothetical protein EDC04DRAFT_2600251 [Pisolithus marmoratus]